MPKTTVSAVTVWIDLDNSPHVPFFVPIIKELERSGRRVVLTTRDESQVCSLAEYHKLRYTSIGKHYGANKLLKVVGMLWRTIQLAPIIIREQPQLSLSHGSRSLILLSSILGVPTMTLFDYEYAQRLPLFKPDVGLAPRAIEVRGLAKDFKRGVRSYDGLKEDVYTMSFKPDASIMRTLGLSEDDIVATIRPPATAAHYHNPESEELFSRVVDLLGHAPRVRMVILPRYERVQRDLVRATWPEWCAENKIIIPSQPLDGLNLIWYSDLVISGGGTMNREAAALGVPVYSIFRGPLGAVDRYLADEGRLVMLRTVDDVRSKIQPIKRTRPATPDVRKRPALTQILAEIEGMLSATNRVAASLDHPQSA